MEKYLNLKKRAEDGIITEDELKLVEKELLVEDTDDNGELKCELIYIIGKANDLSYSNTIASQLHSSDDLVAAAALKVLCDHWNLTSSYIKNVKEFIAAIPDETTYASFAAISIAGEYLRVHEDIHLLRLLLEKYKDNSVAFNAKNSILRAFVRSLGKEWPEVLSYRVWNENEFVDDTKIMTEIIRRINQKNESTPHLYEACSRTKA